MNLIGSLLQELSMYFGNGDYVDTDMEHLASCDTWCSVHILMIGKCVKWWATIVPVTVDPDTGVISVDPDLVSGGC